MGTIKINSHEVEKTNKLPQNLVSQYPKDAAEYKAVELAAKALLYVFQAGVAAQFKLFLQKFHAELTEKQRKRLVTLGIKTVRR